MIIKFDIYGIMCPPLAFFLLNEFEGLKTTLAPNIHPAVFIIKPKFNNFLLLSM